MALASAISSATEVGVELRARHQHQLRGDDLRHRDEVPDHVERQRAVDRRADRLAVGVLQDRVAVGRRLGDRVGRDVAGGARPVLDDHRLAERLGDLGAHHAGERVDGAAGDERHEDAHRLVGVGLGERAAGVEAERRNSDRNRKAQPFHRRTLPRAPCPARPGRRILRAHIKDVDGNRNSGAWGEAPQGEDTNAPGLRARGRSAFPGAAPKRIATYLPQQIQRWP